MANKEPHKKSLFFIGIGGSGMSGLAELAVSRGFTVCGSDHADSATVRRLNSSGIKVFSSHAAENIHSDYSVVYSSAIKHDNAEMAAANLHDCEILHRSDLLARFMKEKTSVTVAGTHGKTTTSAMIVHMLEQLGCDPEAVIGGVMSGSGKSFRSGSGSIFVAEADESDGSFIKYSPFISVLTNIDADHMEFFKTTDNCITAFSDYLRRTHPDGTAVIGWDNPLARTAAECIPDRRLTYGLLLGSEVRGVNLASSGGLTSFTAVVERDQIPCRIRMPGRHNVQNALCALAVARALELDVKNAAEALAEFRGAERRLSLVFHTNNLWIYDDYAHNPGKISACLSAVKEMWPDKKLIAVFQAHRYSRLQTMLQQMLSAFSSADLVVALPVYAAGEAPVAGFTPPELSSGIARYSNTSALPANDFATAVDLVCTEMSPQVIIVTIGAGDVWKVAHLLREKFDGQALSP